MTHRICPCGARFKPKRADAEYCSPRCRTAAHRRREKVADAAVARQRQAEALAIIDQLDKYRSIATLLHAHAKASNRDVGFMATSGGVLAAGSLDTASDLVSVTAPFLRCEAIPGEALREMIFGQPAAGASYAAREAEMQCRTLLARNPEAVAFFSADPDFIEDRNRQASARNQHEAFMGRRQCRCGLSWDEGNGYFECCGETYSDVAVSSTNLRGFSAQRWRR
jgi:hypothetical protein